MNKMFHGCSSLKSLNLSGFNVSLVNNYQKMFFRCKSLKYLDISNFNFISIYLMENMFTGTKNLEFLNIYNFSANETIISNILDDIPDNLVYCIKKNTNISNFIYNYTVKKKCLINYCYEDYKNAQKKILENGGCIDDCKNSIYSKYEYKGRCYLNCPLGTSPSFYNEYLCEENCPKNMKYKLVENNECIDYSPSFYFFNEKCKVIPNNNNINDIIKMTSQIKNELKTGLMNELLNNINDDLIVENNNIVYQLTSSYNQKNKEYKNISSIDLLECENILKEQYKINKNESLIIFKIDYFIEDLNIPIIKFEIFNPKNKEQLDLNYCKSININIPVSINEEILFKYNPNNYYYNNICFPYTTNKGLDIVLIDRKKEYNFYNMSVCEKNCNFLDYNLKTKKVICQCNIYNKTFSSLEDIINKVKLLNNFIDIKSISNLLVMKCYKLLFSKESFFKNIGNYILLSIIIIHIINIIIFYRKGYSSLIHKILNKNEIKNKNNKENIEENELKKDKKLEYENNVDNISNQSNKNMKNNKSINKLMKVDNIDNNKYLDYELNSFSNIETVEKDKRTFFQYYISLIVTRHPLIFIFNINQDYNPIEIKISLFLFSFSLSYTINTLIFNDSTMNKIYEDEGIFNFLYLLPKIIYSFIISLIIIIIAKKFSLIDNKKLENKINNCIKECKNISITIAKYLKIKFIRFFLLSFILFILFWYYISCFCAVYKNTQIILIKDTLISFGFSLLYPFISFLISSIIRIYTINKSEKFLVLFYKVSKII